MIARPSFRCRATCVGILCLVLAAALPACREPDPPHIVIFLVDTLRRDRIGIYGYDRPTTPQIDAFGAESVVFDRAYATSPWTLPSVVSMLTSTFPIDHRVLARGDRVAKELVPLSSRLQSLGYRTGGFSTNAYAGSLSGLDRGYDRFEKMKRFVDIEAVESWLSTVPEERVFLYLHSDQPHRPYRAPTSFSDRFGTVSTDVRKQIRRGMAEYRRLSRVDFETGRTLGTTQNGAGQQEELDALESHEDAIRILYDSGVAWADDNVGNVIELLRRRGMWENTLFLFVSDHGEEFFEHGGILHNQSLYGELVDVPMIWRLPDGPRGIRVGRPASLVDVVPTILDYLGEPCSECAGRSVLPFIDEAASAGDDAPLVTSVRWNQMTYFKPFDDARGNVNVSVVSGRWKGIWNIERSTFELYDSVADPWEQQDLAEEEPEHAAALRRAAEAWLAERRGLEGYETVGGKESLSGLDEETLEQLRTLGYIP